MKSLIRIQQDRQTLPCGSCWQAKLTTSDKLVNFLTRATTFHDLRTTLMTHGDDILMTLKTIGEDTLVTRMTSDEDTLMTPVVTCDYLVTAPNDLTDNPCDNINVEEQ